MTQKQLSRSNWYGIKKAIAGALALPLINELTLALASLILPQHLLHRLPVRAAKTRFRLKSGDSVILLNPRADVVAKDIHWGNGTCTSRADLHVLRWLEANASDADLFVDVGAYSGLFSFVAAKSGRLKVLAFEIVPENFLLLVSNIVANDLLTQIEARLCGIGCGQQHTSVPPVDRLSSNPTSISLGFAGAEGVTVPVRTLDSFGLAGNMIWKIDVESFEWTVIQSGASTIRLHKPHIICEILPWFEHSREIEAFLRPLGYRFFLSCCSGLEERSALKPDRAGRDWIFLADRAQVKG